MAQGAVPLKSLTADGINLAGDTIFWHEGDTPVDGSTYAIKTMANGRSQWLASLVAVPTPDLSAYATTAYVDAAVAAVSLTPAVILAPAATARNVIQSTGNFVELTIRQKAGQGVNLQEWQTSASTVVGSIDTAGTATFVNTFPGNDAIQYSTAWLPIQNFGDQTLPTYASGTAPTLVTPRTDTGARAITLPACASGTNSYRNVILIVDEKGNAAANNITVTAHAGDNINGAGTAVINTNYGSLWLIMNGNKGWTIV